MTLNVDLRRRVHRKLLSQYDGEQIDDLMIRQVINETAPLLGPQSIEQLTEHVRADVHGFGLLEPYIKDDSISDLMVVGSRGIWTEQNGNLVQHEVELSDVEVMRLIERMVTPLGKRIDRASPMVDARLPDGSRVHAIIPPLAIDGPCLTIRRFANAPISLDQMASESMAEILIKAVRERRNILISGGTGSGKTTLLNAMAAAIEPTSRIITIEDAAELRLPLSHVVRLESRPANTEGVGLVTLRDLVRSALRMRPDRIIVGEVRGPEALEMLQAMNTGHEGSMSTCHANSPRDAIDRLETMVLMSDVDLPLNAIQRQISSSVDLIVQVARTNTAHRVVTHIAELLELDGVPTVNIIADVDGNGTLEFTKPPRNLVFGNNLNRAASGYSFRGCNE